MKLNQQLLTALLIGTTLLSTPVFAADVNPQTGVATTTSTTTKAPGTKEKFETFYRTQATNAIQKYFDSNFKEPKKVEVINYGDEATIQKMVKEAYDWDYKDCVEVDKMSEEDAKKMAKQWSDEYAERMKKEKEQLGHNYAEVIYTSDEFEYVVTYNTDTQEMIYLNFCDMNVYSNESTSRNYRKEPLSDSEIQGMQSIATDYIKKYQLGGIESPQLIKTNSVGGKASFLYQDASDASKKVIVATYPAIKKVAGFALSTYADMEIANKWTEVTLK